MDGGGSKSNQPRHIGWTVVVIHLYSYYFACEHDDRGGGDERALEIEFLNRPKQGPVNVGGASFTWYTAGGGHQGGEV